MGLLIVHLLVFAFFLWATTSVLAQKGWPLVLGLLLAFALHGAGRLLIFVGAWLLGTLAFARGLGGVGTAWIVFSGLFATVPAGFIAVGIAMLFPATQAAREAEAAAHTATVPCPECGRENAATTRVCPRCGNRAEQT